MNTLVKILFATVIMAIFNVMAYSEGKLEGEALRQNVIERLPKLNHTKIEALMQRVGKKTPKNFYNCLCRQDRGGAAMGVGVSYHPEPLEPYNEKYSCNREGPPCMASGLGCWRFPLPSDSKMWNYCMKKYTYDDNTTIVDAIVGVVEELHGQRTITKKLSETHIIVDKTFAECPTQDCWIQQARDQLMQVLSDPNISREERIRIVKKSAKTLKEYGQSSAFPSGDIPLKKLVEANYNQSRKDWEGFQALFDLFNKQLLDKKLKLINEMQIEVVGEQISFLIPGATTFSMSKNLIQTVFDWDIVSGVNKGREGTATGLVERFRELANTKEIVKKLDILYEDSRRSTKKLYDDLNHTIKLQDELREIYNTSSNSNF